MHLNTFAKLALWSALLAYAAALFFASVGWRGYKKYREDVAV